MTIGRSARVTFVEPDGVSPLASVHAAEGRTLLDVAREAGVDIVTTCGGRGACCSCRIKVLGGEVSSPTAQDRLQLGHEAVHERFRLSCQARVVSDCTVAVAPPRAEFGHQLLGAADAAAPAGRRLDSGVEKRVVVAVQDAREGRAEVDALLASLPGTAAGDVPLDVLRRVPRALRERDGVVTVTTFNDRVIDVEAGDTVDRKYGMAFDIGTTSLVATLLDLDSGEQLASIAKLNPQATYGADLMSRIGFAQFNEANLATLRAVVLNAVNEFTAEACAKAGVDPAHVYKIVVVGNPCMHHILAGFDVTHLGFAPYAPVVRHALEMRARELPLKAARNAQVCFLPIVAGFVGADAVAAVLATHLHGGERIRLLIDIGTNTEVVLGSRDRLMACSAPAGPAFEGGQIRHGMRAAMGAIEGVEIAGDVVCKTIGNVPAIGICGSGLIDAAAKMLAADVLGPSGVLRGPEDEGLPASLRARLRATEHGSEFLVTPVGEDQPAIAITQSDIRQLQLAKGAIHAAVAMLQHAMGIDESEIEEVMLCGAFGNYVSVDSAMRIGLLPQVARERIAYVGNAAHAGAEMALLSEACRKEAAAVAAAIEHVALAERPEFQDLFVSALSLCADPARPRGHPLQPDRADCERAPAPSRASRASVPGD